MSIDYFLDHEERALDFLLGQFEESANLKSVVKALITQVQEADNATIDTIRSRMLKWATGDSLDQYGKIVGFQRGDLDGFEYRSAIKASIQANNSEGTIDTLLDAYAKFMLANTTDYWAHYPAGLHLDAETGYLRGKKFRGRVDNKMMVAVPAGVSVTFTESQKGAFRFDSQEYGFGSPLSTRILSHE